MKTRSTKQSLKLRTDMLSFGKYKGNHVSWILENNPVYIIWLHDESIGNNILDTQRIRK